MMGGWGWIIVASGQWMAVLGGAMNGKPAKGLKIMVGGRTVE